MEELKSRRKCHRNRCQNKEWTSSLEAFWNPKWDSRWITLTLKTQHKEGRRERGLKLPKTKPWEECINSEEGLSRQTLVCTEWQRRCLRPIAVTTSRISNMVVEQALKNMNKLLVATFSKKAGCSTTMSHQCRMRQGCIPEVEEWCNLNPWARCHKY